MKKNSKLTFIFSALAISIATFSTAIGITYASYWSKKSITQVTGFNGELTTYPIFLDTNGSGDAGWEKDSAIFYMYAFNSSNTANFEWIPATSIGSAAIYNSTLDTISNTYAPLYWFRFDSSKYNSFNFVRFNPDGSTIPSWNRDDNPQSLWDQTSAQTYDSTKNLYHIRNLSSDRISNGDGYGHETAGIEVNASKLAENISSGKLYFMPTTTS